MEMLRSSILMLSRGGEAAATTIIKIRKENRQNIRKQLQAKMSIILMIDDHRKQLQTKTSTLMIDITCFLRYAESDIMNNNAKKIHHTADLPGYNYFPRPSN